MVFPFGLKIRAISLRGFGICLPKRKLSIFLKKEKIKRTIARGGANVINSLPGHSSTAMPKTNVLQNFSIISTKFFYV